MKYEESFKKHCVNLVVKASVTREFNLSQGLIKHWVDKMGTEMLYRHLINKGHSVSLGVVKSVLTNITWIEK